MHPISKTNFGVTGIQVRYYNGTSVVNGYIVKQLGTRRYMVTDGTNPKKCHLAKTAGDVSGLGSGEPTICTIPISSAVSGATGAIFVPTYGVDYNVGNHTTIAAAGSGWSASDTIVATGGVRPIGTITLAVNPLTNDTLTVDGVVITFGTTVTIGGTAALTAAALYTFLTGLGSGNAFLCNYVNITGSNVITVISKTVGTANNAFTLATSAPARITVPATLAGGLANPAGEVTAPTIVAGTVSGSGAVTALTISTAGSFTALPTSPVFGYANANGRMPVQIGFRFTILSIATSAGTGYAVNDALIFNGINYVVEPTAVVSSVTSGVPTAVTVSVGGSGISVPPTTISVGGVVEHVYTLYSQKCHTVEGHDYFWSLKTQVNGSAVIAAFSQ